MIVFVKQYEEKTNLLGLCCCKNWKSRSGGDSKRL